MLRVDVSKKLRTALSSKEGELLTSTTMLAPASASARPCLVRVLTPEDGEALATSSPRPRRLKASFFPMRPEPPMITNLRVMVLILKSAASAGTARPSEWAGYRPPQNLHRQSAVQ